MAARGWHWLICFALTYEWMDEGVKGWMNNCTRVDPVLIPSIYCKTNGAGVARWMYPGQINWSSGKKLDIAEMRRGETGGDSKHTRLKTKQKQMYLRCSLTMWNFFSHHAQRWKAICRGYRRVGFTADKGKGSLNLYRDRTQGKHRRRKM